MYVFVSAKLTVVCTRSNETRNQNQELHKQRNPYECTALLVYDLTYWHLHLLIPLSQEKKVKRLLSILDINGQ